MNLNNMTVSHAPHIHDKATTSRIMLDVIIALIPAFIVSIWVFGPRAGMVTAVCVGACVFFEWAFAKITKRKNTTRDFSAIITGLLLAFNLPVTIPMWQAIVGSFVAIILVKQLFGGLGKNFANPAVTARVVMFLAFPITMTTWVVPQMTDAVSGVSRMAAMYSVDAITGATPLAILSKGTLDAMPGMRDLFIGIHGGCIGETSELALLIGFVYLLIRRVISPIIPFTFIATVFVIMAISGGLDFGLYHILSGGLFLGAIFCATDYVTSPITNKGRIIFGVGIGLLTVMIRLFGSYPEGVSFAILLMNMVVPFINKISLKKALGGKTA